MSLRQSILQKNSLNLTPQLKQSLKILEMGVDELYEALLEAEKNNPLLQIKCSSSGTITPHHPVNKNSLGGASNNNNNFYENIASLPLSLEEVIEQQINIKISDDLDRVIAFTLFENINHNGYLEKDEYEIATQYGFDLSDVERVLLICQSFEPTGIFARNLKECMFINARSQPWFSDNVAKLIKNIDLASSGKLSSLAKLSCMSLDEVSHILRQIKSFNLLPAKDYNISYAQVIVPDIFLEINSDDGEIIVTLNEAVMPKVYVDSSLYQQYKASMDSYNDKEFIKKNYDDANFYKRALDQRYSTLLKVAKIIAEKQRTFFELGHRALRPMTLSDVAQEVGMHESTVSRAVSNKYIETPQGTFELKYFFTQAIKGSGSVNSFSNESIKQVIKRLIELEDPISPLSDDKIVEMLRVQGISIARRTVTKYRESMGIPSSFNRKRRIVL